MNGRTIMVCVGVGVGVGVGGGGGGDNIKAALGQCLEALQSPRS